MSQPGDPFVSWFKDPKYAAEVKRWLRNRATADEKQRVTALLSTLGGSTPDQLRALSSRPATSEVPESGGRDKAASPKLRPATAAPLARPAAGASPQASGVAAQGGVESTYTRLMGMRDNYPQLYAIAAAAAKPEQCGNLTFVSEWGNSLKKGSDMLWQPYLKSTYDALNDTVHKPSLEVQVAKDKGFYSWCKRQQLYYGTILTPQLASKVDNMLEASTAQEKKTLVSTMRLLHAVCRPDIGKPGSHVDHCPKRPFVDSETEELQKMVTEYMTMGRTKKMSKELQAAGIAGPTARTAKPSSRTRPASASAGSQQRADLAAVAMGRRSAGTADLRGPPSESASRRPRSASGAEPGGKRKGANGAAKLKITTFESQVPLKQSGANLTPVATTYQEDIAFNAGRIRAASEEGKGAVKSFIPIVVTSPYGSVDRNLDLSNISKVPVPEAYVRGSILPFTDAERNPPETTNLSIFAPRAEHHVKRSLASAVRQMEISRVARSKSSLPLGKHGICSRASWESEYQGSMHPHRSSMVADRETSRRYKAALNGPTSSVGALMGAPYRLKAA